MNVDEQVENYRKWQLKNTKTCQQIFFEKVKLRRQDRCCCCLYVRTGAKIIILTDFLGFVFIFYIMINFLFLGAQFNFSQFYFIGNSRYTLNDIWSVKHGRASIITYVLYSIFWQLFCFGLRVFSGLATFYWKFSQRSVEVYYYAYLVTSCNFVINSFVTVMIESYEKTEFLISVIFAFVYLFYNVYCMNMIYSTILEYDEINNF